MSLNIKNEQTHALVRELALRTGETQVEAVRTAVSERLRLLEAEPGAARRLATITALSDEISAHRTSHAATPADADFYDEDGLYA